MEFYFYYKHFCVNKSISEILHRISLTFLTIQELSQ